MANYSTFEEQTSAFEKLCGYKKCYDVKKREFKVAGHSAVLYFTYCYANDLLISTIISFYLSLPEEKTLSEEFFIKNCSPCGDFSASQTYEDAAFDLMRGASVLLVDGIENALVGDTRTLPSRSIDEPETDRVLRGARDGFVENLKQNTAILRRRLVMSDLVMKKYDIGKKSRTMIILCYASERADMKFVEKIEKKLQNIDTDALSMGHESLAECLLHKNWWNPFPKFRYTERPDAACAMIMEGSVIIMVDNSPQVMILPCSLFDFLQESDDFYFPPLVGSYMRILRGIIFLISMLVTPVWYFLIKNPELIPRSLDFLVVKENPGLPIIVQLILVEILMDGLKLASMNTPSSLNSSLSIVAGLIIGDFAIQVGWFIPEVILYMAFVATANYTQPSFELGYAIKFSRIILLISVALFDFWGLVIGVLIFMIMISLNKTVDGSRSYLYPLIPFRPKVLKRQLFRYSKNRVDKQK